MFPNLLKQTVRKIIEISGDGAYDTRDCHDALRLQQEMEKEGTLSQALAIRDNNVSSETAVRWQETRMLKLATLTL